MLISNISKHQTELFYVWLKQSYLALLNLVLDFYENRPEW